MLKAIQKILLIILITVAAGYLAYEGFLYYRSRDQMPPGMTVAGIDVSGMNLEEVEEALNEHYLSPIFISNETERVEVNPADFGFVLDMDYMLGEAEALSKPKEEWQAFLEFVVGRSLSPVSVELRATHDREALQREIETLASFMDSPATGPRLIEETESYEMGKAGFVTDVDASLPLVEAALYEPFQREVQLVIIDQEPKAFDMAMLEQSIDREIQGFDGLGSFFILDLQTGEELGINADVALSGLSVVKIAILLETYRAIDTEPNSDQAKLIAETAEHSGNYSANLLLDVVAGMDNAYLGVDILTESMQRLGLENTFIVTPYEEPNRAGKETLITPANSVADLITNPDPTMQTTAEDMGTLLEMIYHCSKGGGTLLALYPEELTPGECQAVIDSLSKNMEAYLIRYGVPPDTVVSHKHGWAGNTHGDAGIVFSPAGDYIIVEYLSQPQTDWLVHDTSFPLLREVSRAVYNYFNVDAPYFGVPDLGGDAADESAPADEETGEEAVEEGSVEEETDTGSEIDIEEVTPTPPPEDGALPPGVEAFILPFDWFS
ncbi:MAG: serine hydrolase [Candidatus Promineifilaceae bacterium]|jgi:beta-lactamase class A